MNSTKTAVWKNCLSFIKDNIQPQAFKTWFEPIEVVKLSENILHPKTEVISGIMASKCAKLLTTFFEKKR